MADPSIVGSPSPDSDYGSSASLTRIVGLADGDSVVIVVALASITSPAITWPAGFELIHSARVDRFASYGYFAVARKHNVTAASEPASWQPSWTGSFAYQAIAIAMRSGNGLFMLADDVEGSSTTLNSTTNTGQAVTVGAGAMVIAATLVSDDGGTPSLTVTDPAGYTQRLNARIAVDESHIYVGTKAVTSGSSGAPSFSLGDLENWQDWAHSFVDGDGFRSMPRAVYDRSLAVVPTWSRGIAEPVYSRRVNTKPVFVAPIGES